MILILVDSVFEYMGIEEPQTNSSEAVRQVATIIVGIQQQLLKLRRESHAMVSSLSMFTTTNQVNNTDMFMLINYHISKSTTVNIRFREFYAYYTHCRKLVSLNNVSIILRYYWTFVYLCKTNKFNYNESSQ